MRPNPEPSAPPIAGVRLTPMHERDLVRVLAIEREAYADPWKKEHFLQELFENRFAVSRTLRLEDLVIGYAMAWLARRGKATPPALRARRASQPRRVTRLPPRVAGRTTELHRCRSRRRR